MEQNLGFEFSSTFGGFIRLPPANENPDPRFTLYRQWSTNIPTFTLCTLNSDHVRATSALMVG